METVGVGDARDVCWASSRDKLEHIGTHQKVDTFRECKIGLHKN